MSRIKPLKAVRSILYIHVRLRYYPSNNPTYFLATNVTKMLDHNKGGSKSALADSPFFSNTHSDSFWNIQKIKNVLSLSL